MDQRRASREADSVSLRHSPKPLARYSLTETQYQQEASDCVAMTRYPPRGRRAFGPFIGHSRWGVPFQDYRTKVGGTVACNILIETKAAIDNIEAICAVEGISVLVLAPFDLSVELGCPHQFDNPIFLKAVDQFERATTAANVPRSTLSMTEQQFQSALNR